MKKDTKTERIAIRVTPTIKKALEKRAKENFRTISQEVEMLITVVRRIGNAQGRHLVQGIRARVCQLTGDER